MSRLIDADALIETLKILRDGNKAQKGDIEEIRIISIGVQTSYNTAIEAVQHEPTIDAAPVWISVKDRMPEISGYYLVYINDEYMPCFKIAYWMSTKNRWIGADVHITITGVTHWMLLPKPPIEVTP